MVAMQTILKICFYVCTSIDAIKTDGERKKLQWQTFYVIHFKRKIMLTVVVGAVIAFYAYIQSL